MNSRDRLFASLHGSIQFLQSIIFLTMSVFPVMPSIAFYLALFALGLVRTTTI